MGQGGDGAVSDLCLESSLGPFNVSSISVYDKQPCVAGQGKNHASGRPDTAAHPVCIQSHAQTWPGVLVTSFCHSGEQRDKQVTTAASSPISGFRAFPLDAFRRRITTLHGVWGIIFVSITLVT